MFNGLIGFWVHADAKTKGFDIQRRGFYMAFAIVLTEIAVPVYLVKSRGWKEAGKTSMRFVLYLCVALVLAAVLQTILSHTWFKLSGRGHR